MGKFRGLVSLLSPSHLRWPVGEWSVIGRATDLFLSTLYPLPLIYLHPARIFFIILPPKGDKVTEVTVISPYAQKPIEIFIYIYNYIYK